MLYRVPQTHSRISDFPRINTFVFELIMTALWTTELTSSVAFDFTILVLHCGLVHTKFPEIDTCGF